MLPCPTKVAKLIEIGVLRNSVQKLRDGQGRTAVGAFDDGGDAFAQVILGGRDAEDAAPPVRVNIDEARSDHHPARIDADRRRRIGQQADGRDGVATDADIRVKPGAAGAIDHLGSGDENVEAVGLSEDRANRRE